MSIPTRETIITGGSGGIGAATQELFRADGWTVHAPSRNEMDVTDEAAILNFFNSKNPELLVCAAGVAHDALLAHLSESAWMTNWETNFQGALHCARAAIPAMIARGGGHVIFLSSYSAIHPPIGQAAYATAKAALIGLTTDLAHQYGPSNIRINTILPGFLDTRMTDHVPAKRREKVVNAHVLGRLNTCREVAAFIRFLHLELPHTSGQVFQLDSRPREIHAQ